MKGKSFFIDLSRCIACRGCQIACKEWHGLPATETKQWGSYQNPADLNFYTYKLVRFQEQVTGKRLNWFFFPDQCRHCINPPCKDAADGYVKGAIVQDPETGAVIFNLERMNELYYYNGSDPEDRTGFRLIQTSEPCHPYMGLPQGGPRFWPTAHIIGYEHTFINTIFALCEAVAKGEQTWPSFEDGLKTQLVLAACEKAAKSGKWEKI